MYNNVIFDGVILTNITNVKVNSVITDNMPDILISQGKLARNDGIKIYNKEYGSKKIIVEGNIVADSRNNFLTARNLLVKATEPIGKTLVLPMDGSALQYTATCSNIIFSDVGGGYAKFNLEFVCSDPYGYDVGQRVLLDSSAITTATSTKTYLEVIGGYFATPIQITYIVISATGVTSSYVEFTNSAGESIRVTRDWTAGDVLTIDTGTHEVKVNGLFVDYSGVFWLLGIDSTALTYADSFTTRSATISAVYRRRTL